MKWSNIFKKSSDKPAQAWQFSTNIMCNGCIAKVQPLLDQAEGIASWKVDLSTPHRILTIVPDGITEDQLLTLIRQAGFTIERI